MSLGLSLTAATFAKNETLSAGELSSEAQMQVSELVAELHHCCAQVSDRFLNGHSNEQLSVIGASIQKNPAPPSGKAALLMAAED